MSNLSLIAAMALMCAMALLAPRVDAAAFAAPASLQATAGRTSAVEQAAVVCTHRRVCRQGAGCAWRKVCKRR